MVRDRYQLSNQQNLFHVPGNTNPLRGGGGGGLRFSVKSTPDYDVELQTVDTAELLDAETAIELESDDLDPPDSDPSEFEVNTSLFGKINIRAAESLLLYGGKTTLGAKERAGCFYKNP